MTNPDYAGKLHLGAAYYPEHWPEERWPEDVRLMKDANLTVVRMGEFAWSTFEPSEGEFHFDWMDRAIALLSQSGIASVMGTPTAAPPAWLTQKYPDTLAVDEFGRRAQHGNRCHYCVTSPEYHTSVKQIVTAMAEHYGPNPEIIGWQLDNEYGRMCYCDRCRKLFQEFLAEKYGSLDALNEHWSASYWSQTYSAWEQIPIPIGAHNPGLMLEWKRFFTECYVKFQKIQLDVLRPHLQPEVWVTHNFMGWFDGFDHYRMNAELDMASWDWYVGTGHHDYLSSGAVHDLTRGFKRKNFWVMETQPGSVNWSTVNNMLDKGEARTMAWHAVAHGADAILYWQWRSALGGQEQYHGSLIDASGQPRPFYEEVQHLGKDFQKVGSLFQNTKPASQVALLYDYDSRWSIQWQRHHSDFDYVSHFLHYYKPFAARNIPMDVIQADTPLDGYRIVIAPALLMLNQKRVDQLTTFVKRGGKLVLTARTGMKDDYNALLPSRQPGPLAQLAGVEVEEYYALKEPVPIKGNWFSGECQIWAERLKLLDDNSTQVIARYGASNGWLDDQIGITVRGHGNGLIYYVGMYLDDKAQDILIDRIASVNLVRQMLPTQRGVEVCKRIGTGGTEIYIIINHQNSEQKIYFPWTAREYISGTTGSGEFKLQPYGVAVLTLIKQG